MTLQAVTVDVDGKEYSAIFVRDQQYLTVMFQEAFADAIIEPGARAEEAAQSLLRSLVLRLPM